jgi:hypothetical protein
LPPDIDWPSLADPATTTAIYMPTRTLAALVTEAIAHGLDPATPAVAIARDAARSNRHCGRNREIARAAGASCARRSGADHDGQRVRARALLVAGGDQSSRHSIEKLARNSATD